MSINLKKPKKISLKKKDQIQFNLHEFIELVYKVDSQEIEQWEFYNFYHELDESDIDKDDLQYITEKYNLDDEQGQELLYRIMENNYESTYIEDTITSFQGNITDTIKRDFENIYKINSYVDDFKFDKIEVANIDFRNNRITFNSTCKNFAKMLVSVINDYGMFVYDSIDDFFDSYPANTEKQKRKTLFDHLSYLGDYENINGTIYGIFKAFDLSKLDTYNNFGSYCVTNADIDNYIKDYGLDDF